MYMTIYVHWLVVLIDLRFLTESTDARDLSKSRDHIKYVNLCYI